MGWKHAVVKRGFNHAGKTNKKIRWRRSSRFSDIRGGSRSAWIPGRHEEEGNRKWEKGKESLAASTPLSMRPHPLRINIHRKNGRGVSYLEKKAGD